VSAEISIQIADAMVEAINAAELSAEVEAVRRYVVAFDLRELGAVRVSVVPAAVRESMSSRGSDSVEIDIDLAVQRIAHHEADVDALMRLTDDLVALFRFVYLPNDNDARNTAVARKFIYDAEGLEAKKLFTSLSTLTFRFFQ
jgi:hypothetical protein